MPADPTIRDASASDIEAVLELWAVARSAHATTDDRPDDLLRLLSTQPGSLLVAEHEGAVVGALVAAWDGWRGNLYRLAVHPDHRRRGLGVQLVDAGEQYLRACGARRVTALVGRADSRAAAFWDAAGYPIDAGIGRRVRNL